MVKFRLYFNKDKETKWVNEMVEQGYAMTGFKAGFFKFQECPAGKYIYQTDFSEKFFSVSKNYREFMAENDIEIIAIWGFWVFLRKEKQNGKFELYTDVDSKIEHYTKIRNMFKIVTIFEIICLLITTISTLQNPRHIYSVLSTIIMSIIVIGFMNITFKTNKIIAELKEIKGEAVTFPDKQKFSPFLLCGMGLSSFSILISINHTLDLILKIIAIILMLIGLFQSKNNFKN